MTKRIRSYEQVTCTIYEKICPNCGKYVEVLPEANWEAEHHFRAIGSTSGETSVRRCPGSGTFIPEGEPRTRVVMRLKGYKK